MDDTRADATTDLPWPLPASLAAGQWSQADLWQTDHATAGAYSSGVIEAGDDTAIIIAGAHVYDPDDRLERLRDELSRRWNAHDELVAALRGITEAVTSARMAVEMNRARAALAKATA